MTLLTIASNQEAFDKIMKAQAERRSVGHVPHDIALQRLLLVDSLGIDGNDVPMAGWTETPQEVSFHVWKRDSQHRKIIMGYDDHQNPIYDYDIVGVLKSDLEVDEEAAPE